MSLQKTLMPYLLDLRLSEKLLILKRKLFKLKIGIFPWLNEITFYHRLNDPYSYLLLQALMEFEPQHSPRINIELLFELPQALNPEVEKYDSYAFHDANRLIKFHQFKFPHLNQQPSRRDTFRATSCLLKQKATADKSGDYQHYMQLVSEVTSSLWGHSSTTLQSCINRYGELTETETRTLLGTSKENLVANGHYMSAMLNYGGEWYWGVDRLHFLQQRLQNLFPSSGAPAYSSFQDNYLSLTLTSPRQKHSVDFYFSFRSPYSYLAAEKLFKMASQLQFDVNIKPVLPMVMRGFKIPKIKRLYIVEDVKREASKQGIAFGKICDPIGGGIERCLALFPYAKSEFKERAFISSMSRGIWSEGADVSDDEVMARLLTRAGLNWQIAQKWLNKTEWQVEAEQNRQQLDALGLWGVPSFTCAEKLIEPAVWGQDRLWVIEEALQNNN